VKAGEKGLKGDEWEQQKNPYSMHSANIIPQLLLQRSKTEASTVFPPRLTVLSQMCTFQTMLKHICLKLH